MTTSIISGGRIDPDKVTPLNGWAQSKENPSKPAGGGE
jgi:hypothetical protein